MKINSEEELNEAVDIIDKLISKGELTDEEDAYINDLADAIEAYEDIHHPMGSSTLGSMLCFLMDQHSLNDAALIAETGIYDITLLKTDQRKPTSAEAELLANRFNVDVSLFLEDGDGR